MYFETHAHYDFKNFDENRENLLNSLLPNADIEYIINVGIDMQSSIKNVSLSEKYDYIYAAIGFHPVDSYLMNDSDIEKLFELSKSRKVVAIGEIGLDFYHKTTEKKVQIKRFNQLLELAKLASKPVIIHSRDSDEEVYKILLDSKIGKEEGGVLHCFSGDVELAKKYIDLGFYIGIGGIVTYKNAKLLQKTVEEIPTERILIETDSPFLSPVPNRGKTNDSRNLYYIVEKISQLKGKTHEFIAKSTLENAKKLFKIS